MKKKISIIMASILMVLNPLGAVKVKATTIPQVIGISALINRVQNMDSFDDFLDMLEEGSFGLVPGSNFWNRQTLEEYYQQYLEDKGVSDPTEQDMVDDIKNSITVSDNSVTIDSDLRQWIYNQYQNGIDGSEAYCYSYPLLVNSNQFASIDQYNKAGSIIKNNNGVYAVVTPSSGINYIAYYAMGNEHPYRVFKESSANTGRDYGVNVTLYDGATGSAPQPDAYWKWDRPDPTNDPTRYEWIAPDTIPSVNLPSIWICLKPNYTKPYGLGRSYSIFCNNPKSVQYRLFRWGKAVTNDSILYQPYYVNEDTWNDFSSTTGDYVVTDENINTVNYGDVVNYINSFNTENGYPPSPNEINIKIEQENEENKNPSGGGGSGGNGSGSDDSLGVFDFLSRIGQALGNLIKNLGNVLAELVEAIAEIVSSLVESIPTVFGTFIELLLGWLPVELRALITLAIVSMVLVGLIKLFRGS